MTASVIRVAVRTGAWRGGQHGHALPVPGQATWHSTWDLALEALRAGLLLREPPEGRRLRRPQRLHGETWYHLSPLMPVPWCFLTWLRTPLLGWT